MDIQTNENIILESQLLEVASHTNYKEATFLISVLGEPDRCNRIIPEDVGEKYAETLIGYPIVAKLKKNIFGQPSDFGGHEVYEIKAKNGKKVKRFGTIPIGSVLDAWVEERELDGYDEPKKCILCKTKLWSGRFPEYFKVLDKLWKNGNVSSSWELTASKIEEKDGCTIFKVIEFIGNCILGTTRVPCVPGAGILEYAEFDNCENELAEALEKDLADLDINENEIEKEEVNLAEKTKKDPSVEDTEVKDNTNVDDTEKEKKDKKDTAECGTKKKKKTTTAEVESEEPNVAENSSESKSKSNENETQTASLTQHDLFQRISRACREALNRDWGYISYWFPEDKTVWYAPEGRESELDYKLFTYEVSNDEVTVSEPQDVKLTVSVTEVNSVIAEKDKKIGDLTAELEIKEDAIIKAGETMNRLKVEISELKPYKEAADQAEQARVEAEIAEVKETLKNNMLKNNLFTEEEVSSAEIAELIEARNETAIKSLIADRYIANLEKAEAESPDTKEKTDNTAIASLDVDDEVNENPVSYMARILRKH